MLAVVLVLGTYLFIHTLWQLGLIFLANENLWTYHLLLSKIRHQLEFYALALAFSGCWYVDAYLLARPVWLLYTDQFVWLLRGIAALFFVLTLWKSLTTLKRRRYILNRWKAWTGPSRTGIPYKLLKYIGNEADWAALNRLQLQFNSNPIEYGARWTSAASLIEADPTDLLKARAASQRTGPNWLPDSDLKKGVYHPIQEASSGSLLWGEDLGFHRRCSRGIISVPARLLSLSPKSLDGFNGQSMCLAYGILARNKGLQPSLLVCNLNTNGRMGLFEESSVWWPRVSKTLRGYHRAEFEKTFSLLGDAYVTAATELSLLLADALEAVVEDWLDGGLEQQDLALNNEAAELGASSEDLSRLYRGQYAAMLASLSVHTIGTRIRPELAVFDRLCEAEGQEIPEWARGPRMQQRRLEERESLGPSLGDLVRAIL